MLRPVLVALTLTAAAATAASAQVRISLAGGPTVPVGILADDVDLGYHAQLSAALGLPALPIGVRFDGALNQFPETAGDGSFRMISGTANAVLSVPSIGFVPYLIGGLGVYRSEWLHDEEEPGHDHGDEATTNLGANVGVGARLVLPSLAVFAEARLHHLFTEGEEVRFAPISLGIRF